VGFSDPPPIPRGPLGLNTTYAETLIPPGLYHLNPPSYPGPPWLVGIKAH